MTRDDRHTRRDFAYQGILYHPGGTIPWFQGTRNLMTYRSLRADAVSTPRSPSGAYIHATKYHSFHCFAEHKPYIVRQYGIGGKILDYVEDVGEAAEPPFPYWETYGCGYYAPHGPLVASDVISRVKSKLMARARSAEWELGTAVGEAREAGRGLGMIIRQAYDIIDAFMRNHNRDLMRALPKSLTAAAAAAVLTYLYALKPLAQDAYKAIETLGKGVDNSEPLARIFVDEKDPSHRTPSIYSHLEGGVDGSFKRGFKSEIRIRLANSNLYALDRYGLTNPLTFAWELIPLSFVVDWFLHIGSFLDALVPPFGITFDGGYETSYLENRWRATWKPKGGYYVALKAPSMNVVTKSHQRLPLYVFPLPRPYLDLDLSVTQAIAALALLKTRYGA